MPRSRRKTARSVNDRSCTACLRVLPRTDFRRIRKTRANKREKSSNVCQRCEHSRQGCHRGPAIDCMLDADSLRHIASCMLYSNVVNSAQSVVNFSRCSRGLHELLKSACDASLERAARLEFDWNVEDFSHLSERPCHSPIVFSGSIAWRITLYPHGQSDGKSTHLSAYLEGRDLKRARQAKFSLTFVNQLDEQASVVQAFPREKELDVSEWLWFKRGRSDWGLHKQIPLRDVNDPSKGFLIDDTLIIRARIVSRHYERILQLQLDEISRVARAKRNEPAVARERKRLA